MIKYDIRIADAEARLTSTKNIKIMTIRYLEVSYEKNSCIIGGDNDGNWIMFM